MSSLPQPDDKRIAELLTLASEEGRPLALRPETIIILEDAGMVVEPFTAQFWRDPAVEPPALTLATLRHPNQNGDVRRAHHRRHRRPLHSPIFQPALRSINRD